MTRHATYVYCLAVAKRAPALGRGPRGLPGTGPLRLLSVAEDRRLVVADAPLDRYGAEAIARGLKDMAWVGRCALAHEAVVEHVAAAGSVVPLKLFTLFGDDERALAHMRKLGRRLDRIVEAVSGRSEWSLRIYATAGAPRAARAARPTTGAGFLAAKKKLGDQRKEAAARAREEAERIVDELSARADAALSALPAATGNLLVEVVFLVAARAQPGFRAAARKLAAPAARAGLKVDLSGPWPPYHFVARAA